MHLHTINDLDHDLSLFDERETFTCCDNCGARTDEHGISVDYRRCPFCAGDA